ncbi:MAG: DUF1330 domain-containing protein [Vicinamibacterales bacterium]
MAAYLIVDIAAVHDEAAYAEYRNRVTPGLEAAGGRYLVRGGPLEVLEGDWHPRRLVVVRFDSVQQAKTWWASADYEPLRRQRAGATTTHMVIVEGLGEAGA